MILIAERIVAAILNTLEFFFVGHLCVKLTILVDVLFVFYFLRISQGRECLRVLCFKLSQALLVLLLCYDLLRFAACFNGFQIIRREVLLEVAFCIGNEFGNLLLMRCFNRLCLIEKSLLLGNLCGALIGSNRLVTFCGFNVAHRKNNLVGAIQTKIVNLLLNGADILINRLAQFQLLLSRQDRITCVWHIHQPSFYRYFALRRRSSS